jgi:hypothetical protein
MNSAVHSQPFARCVADPSTTERPGIFLSAIDFQRPSPGAAFEVMGSPLHTFQGGATQSETQTTGLQLNHGADMPLAKAIYDQVAAATVSAGPAVVRATTQPVTLVIQDWQGRPLSLQISPRLNRVHMVVRAADRELASELRGHLTDVVTQLKEEGVRTGVTVICRKEPVADEKLPDALYPSDWSHKGQSSDQQDRQQEGNDQEPPGPTKVQSGRTFSALPVEEPLEPSLASNVQPRC